MRSKLPKTKVGRGVSNKFPGATNEHIQKLTYKVNDK
jgi:hypothetical protein